MLDFDGALSKIAAHISRRHRPLSRPVFGATTAGLPLQSTQTTLRQHTEIRCEPDDLMRMLSVIRCLELVQKRSQLFHMRKVSRLLGFHGGDKHLV